MKAVLISVVFLGIIASTFGCRKLGWESETKTAECYCVYYIAPGVEHRESFKYGGYNNKNAMTMHCLRKTAELERKYGIGNVRCAQE